MKDTVVRTYRKKPVEIDAIRWDGTNWEEIIKFIPPPHIVKKEEELYIGTPEGDMHCSKGDFIIKGIKGEFYPCKPDIFAATYTLVDWELERSGDSESST